MYCADLRNLFFNDLEDRIAQTYIDRCQPQPAFGWDGTITYTGWSDVPNVYIICEKDACLPESLQIQLAQSASSQIERVPGGHLAMLSVPDQIADIVLRYIK